MACKPSALSAGETPGQQPDCAPICAPDTAGRTRTRETPSLVIDDCHPFVELSALTRDRPRGQDVRRTAHNPATTSTYSTCGGAVRSATPNRRWGTAGTVTRENWASSLSRKRTPCWSRERQGARVRTRTRHAGRLPAEGQAGDGLPLIHAPAAADQLRCGGLRQSTCGHAWSSQSRSCRHWVGWTSSPSSSPGANQATSLASSLAAGPPLTGRPVRMTSYSCRISPSV